LQGVLRQVRTEYVGALAVGAGLGGDAQRNIRLPVKRGIAYAIRMVFFHGGSGNAGVLASLSHNLGLARPDNEEDIVDDPDAWIVSSTAEVGTAGAGKVYTFPDTPYLVAGPQAWRVFNGSSGGAIDLFGQVYFEEIPMSVVRWTELLSRTSKNG
jgi:hypothetical protein